MTPQQSRPVALVTGAARGIGAAACLALAADGWDVVAVDRAADDPRLPYPMGTTAQLEAVVSRCSAHGARALAVVADTTDAVALERAVATTEGQLGGLDAVIAAAGVVAGGMPLWEMPPTQLEAVIAVDLVGVITLARAAVPALLRRPVPRAGRFLAVASTAATTGLPLLAAYCAAKAGVLGLVRALAVELAGTGITAAAVSPGSTDTPILAESARLYELDGPEGFVPQQRIGRLVRPEEVAAALAWLAGPGGAAVTGSELRVDGGLGL